MKWVVLGLSMALASGGVEGAAEPGMPPAAGVGSAELGSGGAAELASIVQPSGSDGGQVGAGVWLPYPTEDPFIWSADACLGYFWTRDAAAMGDGVEVTRDGPRLEAELGRMRGRIQILDGPAGGGAFRCLTTRWPELPPDRDRLDALGRWVEHRLMKRDGWRGAFDPDNPGGLRVWEVASFRHDGLGVTLRVQARFDHRTGSDYLSFELEAAAGAPSGG